MKQEELKKTNLKQECIEIQNYFLTIISSKVSEVELEEIKRKMFNIYDAQLEKCDNTSNFSLEYQNCLEETFFSYLSSSGNLVEDNYLITEEAIENSVAEISSYSNCAALDLYLKEISEVPILTPEEERSLALKISLGDTLAKKEFIERNLRLVVYRARKYLNRVNSLELLDLIQEGNLGLIQAVDKFDLSKGVKFSTYAIHRIDREIRKVILDREDIIHYPVHLSEELYHYQQAATKLQTNLNRYPNRKELMDYLKISEKELKRLEELVFLRKHTSLDKPISSDGGDESLLIDFVTDKFSKSVEDTVFDTIANSELLKVLKELPKDQRDILILHYGLEESGVSRTLNEIMDIKNISIKEIKSLETLALKRLRHPHYRELLFGYKQNKTGKIELNETPDNKSIAISEQLRTVRNEEKENLSNFIKSFPVLPTSKISARESTIHFLNNLQLSDNDDNIAMKRKLSKVFYENLKTSNWSNLKYNQFIEELILIDEDFLLNNFNQLSLILGLPSKKQKQIATEGYSELFYENSKACPTKIQPANSISIIGEIQKLANTSYINFKNLYLEHKDIEDIKQLYQTLDEESSCTFHQKLTSEFQKQTELLRKNKTYGDFVVFYDRKLKEQISSTLSSQNDIDIITSKKKEKRK